MSGLRSPLSMTCSFFTIWTACLSNIAWQSSSQNCPIATRLLLMLGSRFVIVASGASCSCMFVLRVDVMRWLFGNLAVIGSSVISEYISSFSRKKYRVQPVSAMLSSVVVVGSLNNALIDWSLGWCHSGLFACDPPRLFVHVALSLWLVHFLVHFWLMWEPMAPGGK